jgi:hypothetical protein
VTGYLEFMLDVLKAVGLACLVWMLGYFIGHFVKYILVRVLGRANVDDFIRRTGIGRAIRRTGLLAHEFIASLAAWLIYLLFLILGVYFAGLLAQHEGVVIAAETALNVYYVGGLKLLLVVIIGFVLVDAFVGYVYRSVELKSETQLLTPVAEYLRIVLYIAIMVYAVEQSGLGVGALLQLLTPLIWGVTAITVLVVLYLIIQSIQQTRRT